MVDAFSRWVELYPLRTQKATEIAEKMVSYISRFGAPKVVLSDAAANLTGEVMTQLAKIFQMKKLKTSIFSQASNSKSEVINKRILAAFRLHLKDQRQWPTLLEPIQMSLRSTVSNATTGYSPFEILMGKRMNQAIDWTYAQSLESKPEVDPYVKSLISRLKLVQESAKCNSERNQIRNKQNYDKGTAESTFKIGDRVWMKNRHKKIGENRKFYAKFCGPLIIEGQNGHNHFKLRWVHTERLLKNTVCGDHLKHYVDTEEKPYLNKEEQKQRNEKRFAATAPTGNTQSSQQRNLENKNEVNKAPHSKEQKLQRKETKVASPADFTPIKSIIKRRNRQYLVEYLDGSTAWKRPFEVSDAAKAVFDKRPDRNLRERRGGWQN
jgi:hypothetical protein